MTFAIFVIQVITVHEGFFAHIDVYTILMVY